MGKAPGKDGSVLLLGTGSTIPPQGCTHLPPCHLQQQPQETLQGFTLLRCAPHQGGHILRQHLEELETGLEEKEGQGPRGWLSASLTSQKVEIPQGWPFETALCATSLLDVAWLRGGSSRSLSLQGLILPPSSEIRLLP